MAPGGTEFGYSEVSVTMCFGGGAQIHSNHRAVRTLSHFDFSVRLFAQKIVHRNKDVTVSPLMHHIFYYRSQVHARKEIFYAHEAILVSWGHRRQTATAGTTGADVIADERVFV